MRRDFPLPLKVKLSLLITSLVALAVILVGLFLLWKQERTLTDAITQRGRTIAAHLSAGGKSALVSNDDLTLNFLVKQAMEDRDVAYIVFADEKGVVHAHSDVTMIGRPLARPPKLSAPTDRMLIQTYRSDTSDEMIIDFAVPLVFSKTPVGSLYVGFSKTAVTEAIGEARNQAALITAFMIALGVGGAIVLATLLSRPIFELVAATDAVAKGDFSVSVPVTTRDELGVLTESFNRMAKSLREKEMI